MLITRCSFEFFHVVLKCLVPSVISCLYENAIIFHCKLMIVICVCCFPLLCELKIVDIFQMLVTIGSTIFLCNLPLCNYQIVLFLLHLLSTSWLLERSKHMEIYRNFSISTTSKSYLDHGDSFDDLPEAHGLFHLTYFVYIVGDCLFYFLHVLLNYKYTSLELKE